jgi:hypothetical protein
MRMEKCEFFSPHNFAPYSSDPRGGYRSVIVAKKKRDRSKVQQTVNDWKWKKNNNNNNREKYVMTTRTTDDDGGGGNNNSEIQTRVLVTARVWSSYVSRSEWRRPSAILCSHIRRESPTLAHSRLSLPLSSPSRECAVSVSTWKKK